MISLQRTLKLMPGPIGVPAPGSVGQRREIGHALGLQRPAEGTGAMDRFRRHVHVTAVSTGFPGII